MRAIVVFYVYRITGEFVGSAECPATLPNVRDPEHANDLVKFLRSLHWWAVAHLFPDENQDYSQFKVVTHQIVPLDANQR